MARPKRSTPCLPTTARQDQIRALLRLEEHNPAVIARRLALSKPAVMYHVRQMPDVQLVRVQPGTTRWRQDLRFRHDDNHQERSA